MKTVAILCEYNPFHTGHALLFDKIREKLGEDITVICIMSGNFTQRGEAAVFKKQARAAMAVECGADLVLELPFPYSCAGAERFAQAGVRLANSLGCIDYLAFGCECGDTERLLCLATRLETREFHEGYEEWNIHTPCGCAEKTAAVYRTIYGDDSLLPLLKEPNNILGVEYIRAIIKTDSTIIPLAILREGAPHRQKELSSAKTAPSGQSLRDALLTAQNGDETALDSVLAHVPVSTHNIIKNELFERKSLADNGVLQFSLLNHYRFCHAEELRRTDGMSGGLGDRILRAANEAATPVEFFCRLRTKKYTDAYLRRALLYGYFGITREMLNASPLYTQVLGLSERGKACLSHIRKTAGIDILTKPANYKRLSEEARGQAERNLRADRLYCSLFRVPFAPSDICRYAPYQKVSRTLSQS